MATEIVPLNTLDYNDYSFQNALFTATGEDSDLLGNATLGVFQDGCRSIDFGPANCTIACSNPANIWNGSYAYPTYTLQNCMVYPFISYLLASGYLTQNSSEFVQAMGYLPNPVLDLSEAAWPAIAPCINSFCSSDQASVGCGAQFAGNASIYGLDSNITTGDFGLVDTQNGYLGNFSLNFTTNICHGVNGNVNADLGGPGVFLSYLIQIGLAIIAWLNLRMQDSWAQYPVWAITVPFKGSAAAWASATALQKRLRGHDYRNALIESLREFQAAQIFFMVSIEIAVLVVLHNSSDYQANSWQTISNDIGVLFDLTLAGCVPVVFVMLILFAAGDRSAYFTTITTFCVFLSGSAWIATREGSYDLYSAISTNIESFPDTCGGPFAPIEFCEGGSWWYRNSSANGISGLTVGFCWFIALILLLDYIRIFPRPRPSDHQPPITPRSSLSPGPTPSITPTITPSATFNGDLEVQKPPKPRRQNIFEWVRARILNRPFWDRYEHAVERRGWLRWLAKLGLDTRDGIVSRIVKLLLLAMELILLALICILLDDYVRIFTDGKNDGSFAFDWGSWSLGQVISVTLWVSVVFRYLWLTVVGSEAKCEHERAKYEKVASDDEKRLSLGANTAYAPIHDLSSVPSHVSSKKNAMARVYSIGNDSL